MSDIDPRREATLLGLPPELRLAIYAHLMQPALRYSDEDWGERNRRWYSNLYLNLLPETKLIYFTLHALGASCSALHAETAAPIEQVRAALARQRHYCGLGLWGDPNWL